MSNRVNAAAKREIVALLEKKQGRICSEIRSAKYEMKRIVDRQTLLKREKAEIGKLLYQLQPKATQPDKGRGGEEG